MRIGSLARNMWAFVMWMILGLCLGVIILGFAGCAGEAFEPSDVLDGPEPEYGAVVQPIAIKTSGTATWGAKASTLNRDRCDNSTTNQTCSFVYTAASAQSLYKIKVSGFTASETSALNTQIDNFCMSMAQKINAQPAPVNSFSCFRVTDSSQNLLIQKAVGANGPDEVGTYASPLYSGCGTATESLPGTYKPCASATINYAIEASEARLTARGFTSTQKANARLRIVDHVLLAAMGIGGQTSSSSFPSHNLISGSAVGGVLDTSEACRFRNISWGSVFDLLNITSTTGC